MTILDVDFPFNRITLRAEKALRVISQQTVLLLELDRLYESFLWRKIIKKSWAKFDVICPCRGITLKQRRLYESYLYLRRITFSGVDPRRGRKFSEILQER